MNKVNKKIGLDDIAAHLGLSKSTVSRAISGKGRISEATRKVVNDYIKESGYRPNIIAQGFAQSKTFNIAVAIPSDGNTYEIPFFQSCLFGICEVASVLEYDVILSTVRENDIAGLKKLILHHKADGVVLTRTYSGDIATRLLREEGMPFVVVGTSDDEDVTEIDNDHFSACTELTRYVLLRSDLEKTALLVGNRHQLVNKSRISGFYKAYEEKGLLPNESLIITDLTDGFAMENEINLLLKKKPTTIICGDDYICSVLIGIMRKKGINIPTDIKVASFYNSLLLSSGDTPITALEIDAKKLGEIAGRTLIDKIKGKSVPKRTLLDYEILVRKSTSY